MIYWAPNRWILRLLAYYDYANANALDWMKGGDEEVDLLFQRARRPSFFPKDISQPS
jgi:hypothetical protein